MSRIIPILLASFLGLAPLKSISPPNHSIDFLKKIILIDAGHGGKENGWEQKETKEKTLTLKYAKKLEEKLKKQGFIVIQTRNDDYSLNPNSTDLNKDNKYTISDEIIKRTDKIKNNNPNYIISIHFNANKQSKKQNGTEIYFFGIKDEKELTDKRKNIRYNYNNAKIFSEKQKNLALNMQKHFKKNNLESEVVAADLTFLQETQEHNSILLELGYMTNKKDLEYITSEKGKEELTELISDYFRENENFMKYSPQIDSSLYKPFTYKQDGTILNPQ